MGGAIGILLLGGILFLWIFAFMRMHKYGDTKGVQQFFLYLGLVILIGGLLFLIIMVPVIDCSGFLCGLEELLMWVLGCLIMLLVMPIIMLTALVSKLKKSNTNLLKGNQEEIIDEV